MSSHDEPLVVDNFPLGIDVGEEHGNATTNPTLLRKDTNGDWIRELSQLNRIVVIRKGGVGANGEIQTINAALSRDKDLTLTLIDTGGGASSTLTLTWEGTSTDKLRIKSGTAIPFTRPSNGRRLTQTRPLKISSVSWFESANQPAATTFPETAGSNHDSIFVGLYP